MLPEELLDVWAPVAAAWSLWAKPVLFAQLPDDFGSGASPAARAARDVSWAPDPGAHAGFVLELPGPDAIEVGLALARRGYRPVPLFNGCSGPREVVEQRRIQRALHDGAAELQALPLPDDAPPAFLLDALRQPPVRWLAPGTLDNRWRVYPEDFPSAAALKARGVTQLILVHRGRLPLAGDLRVALWYLAQAGLALSAKDIEAASPPRPFQVPRPWWGRRLYEQALAALGLRQRGAAGFGFVIPESTHG